MTIADNLADVAMGQLDWEHFAFNVVKSGVTSMVTGGLLTDGNTFLEKTIGQVLQVGLAGVQMNPDGSIGFNAKGALASLATSALSIMGDSAMAGTADMTSTMKTLLKSLIETPLSAAITAGITGEELTLKSIVTQSITALAGGMITNKIQESKTQQQQQQNSPSAPADTTGGLLGLLFGSFFASTVRRSDDQNTEHGADAAGGLFAGDAQAGGNLDNPDVQKLYTAYAQAMDDAGSAAQDYAASQGSSDSTVFGTAVTDKKAALQQQLNDYFKAHPEALIGGGGNLREIMGLTSELCYPRRRNVCLPEFC
jgi:hypothetical protein